MRRQIVLSALALALACRNDSTASAASARCPEGMLPIPAGTFTMGVTEATEREHPGLFGYATRHPVTLTRPYCIDKTEVTAGAYRKCVAAGACARGYCNARRDDRMDHPMNCVGWSDAETYCRWADKRLPTEAEWEFAARGPKSYRHPWGNSKPDDDKLWYSGSIRRGYATAPVATHHAGASPFGVHDMEGNVVEWVADWDHALRSTNAELNPKGAERGIMRVLKGAAMDSGVLAESDIGDRYRGNPDDRAATRGFRCAR